MGQYYEPIILDEDGNPEVTMYSHHFGNGLKLMEHSWLGNLFVETFEQLLITEAPRRVVWAGDYADPEKDENGCDRTYFWYRDNGDAVEAELTLYHIASEELTAYRPELPDHRYTDFREIDGTYREVEIPPNAPQPRVTVTVESYPFLVNWDRREFVDKRKVDRETSTWVGDSDFRIHPLPLLTVEGNGRGGGDFNGEDPQGLIGRWARDHISVQKNAPAGFTELKFDLHE